MKSIDDLINAAIDEVKGARLPIGSPVAHRDEPITQELIRYEGDIAVVACDGVTQRWPANEIFDPNHARDVALKLLAEQN